MCALPTRNLSGTVTVDGSDYRWQLTREPRVCSGPNWQENYKGMQVTVETAKAPGRQLLIEFPFPRGHEGRGPWGRKIQRPQLQAIDVATAISSALEDGWDPTSRGRPYHFQLPLERAHLFVKGRYQKAD